MKKLIFILIYSLSAGAFATTNTVPTLKASFETTPIPLGEDTTDDTAIWLHPTRPQESIVLGVNKNKKDDGGRGGIGLYDLRGNEITFYESLNNLELGRLNNVDLRYNFQMGPRKIDLVAASNRTQRNDQYVGVTLFELDGENKNLNLIHEFPIKNMNGEVLEPYGLCMGQDRESGPTYIFSLLENGELYQHKISYLNQQFHIELVRIINVKNFITKEQDSLTAGLVVSDVLTDYKAGEFSMEELSIEITDSLVDRHQMEGCVGDDYHKELYFGVEKLGIFKISYDGPESEIPKLVGQIVSSKNEFKGFSASQKRLTDDIEGMAIYHGPKGAGYLVVSVQGISEYAIFSRGKLNNYLGSFKVGYDPMDPVTKTDGFDILSTPLGDDYPSGIMAIHDDENTDKNGNVLNANYKLLSFDKVLKSLGLTNFSYKHDPRN